MSIDGGLRKDFRKGLPKFHWQSIESPFTGAGTPDSNYCFDGAEGWVEHKRAEGMKVKIRVEQIGWHLRRARAGGRTFIAVKKGDTLYLYRGADVFKLSERGLTLPPLLKETGGPASWNWAKVARFLVSPVPPAKPSRKNAVG